MSEKRRDKKGRVLRQGESQRKDGIYQYRYTDRWKQRHCVYAGTLEDLRKKEESIARDVADGIGGKLGEMTVDQLIEQHIKQKRKLRPATIAGYNTQRRTIQQFPLASMQVKDVKKSDVVQFCIEAYDSGRKFSTVDDYKVLIGAAMQIAVDDDAIRKNPARFRLSDYVDDNSSKVHALTKAEVDSLMEFVSNSNVYKRYTDMLTILLGTGLRAGELCGLTVSDIDFANNHVVVDHQILQFGKELHVGDPKTKTGVRCIPMREDVRLAFTRVIARRGKGNRVERIVNGRSGFLFTSRTGKPKTQNELWHIIHSIQNAYNERHQEKIRITPHVFRHTFCTMLSNEKVSLKTIMYLMGHASLDMLRIYDDAQYDVVKAECDKLWNAG